MLSYATAGNNMAEKELLSVEDFMALYSQKRNATYRAINSGRLLIRKVGTRTFIRKIDADAWMNALENQVPP